MGSGSSCTKVEKFNKSVGVPSASIRRKPIPSPSMESVAAISDSDDVEDGYSRIWGKNYQLTSEFQSLKTAKKTTTLKRYQKSTRDDKWPLKDSKSVNPSKEDSPQVDVKVDGETHECITIGTSEYVEEFMKNLNQVNIDIDNEIQRRINVITEEEQLVINKILEDKQTSEEILLQQAKLDQEEQEKRYKYLLEEYIKKLENEKLQRLNTLYESLKQERLRIMDKTQTNITQTTAQARVTKTNILEDVQKQAANRISKLLSNLKQYSNDGSLQQLGGEELTKINMMIFSKFGIKPEGQHCENISKEDLNNFKNTTSTANVQIKKLTTIKPTTNP